MLAVGLALVEAEREEALLDLDALVLVEHALAELSGVAHQRPPGAQAGDEHVDAPVRLDLDPRLRRVAVLVHPGRVLDRRDPAACVLCHQ